MDRSNALISLIIGIIGLAGLILVIIFEPARSWIFYVSLAVCCICAVINAVRILGKNKK